MACEFENAAIEVLTKKTLKAAQKYKAKSIIVGGGVSANAHLRKTLEKMGADANIKIVFPTKALTTDNAIMIGIAGSFGKTTPISSKKLLAQGNMEL